MKSPFDRLLPVLIAVIALAAVVLSFVVRRSPESAAPTAAANNHEPTIRHQAPGSRNPSASISAGPGRSRPNLVPSAKSQGQEVLLPASLARWRSGAATSADLPVLLAFLRQVNPPEGWTADRFFAAKEDVMAALDTAPNPPPELAAALVSLSRDATQLGTTRDYALQHLATLYANVSRRGQYGALTAEQWRQSPDAAAVRQALWDATAMTQQGTSGTALLSLLRIGRDYPEADLPRLKQTALRLAQDETCGEMTRLTAVSVCGRLGVADALPAVERLATADNASHLRIAAIAALGDLGGKDQLQRLEDMAKTSTDTSVKLAAGATIKRLKNRIAEG